MDCILFLLLIYPLTKAQIISQLNERQVLNVRTSVSQYTLINIDLRKATNNMAFFISQVHTQHETVVNSMRKYSTYGFENNATHTGLFYFILHDQQPAIQKTFIGLHSSYETTVIFYAVPYESGSPIPGGCCITCALEVDPNIRITYDTYKTHLDFSRASPWWNPSLGGFPLCDNTESPETFQLTYDVYYKYLNENDFSQDGLFSVLWEMSTPENIRKVGTHLVTIKETDKLRLQTETVLAQGVVFNVIVTDVKTQLSAAYVPTATYACDFTTDYCHSYGSKTTLAYCILFAVIGIVMCFGGYKLYRVWFFCCGVMFYWFLIYIAIARLATNFDLQNILITSSLCSIVGGGFVLLLSAFKKLIYLCILHVGISFGLLVSAIVFYTPLGYLEMWDEDYRFALGYCCVILFVASVFLFYPKILIYFSSSLLGSYAVIMLPNFYVHSNMQYIVVTVLFRLTISDFGSSFLRRPYQFYDYVLTGVWAGLFLLGFFVQFCVTKDEQFVVSGKNVRQKVWQKFSESVKISRHNGRNRPSNQKYYVPEQSEHRPLISENIEEVQRGYNSFDNSATSSSTQPSALYRPVCDEPDNDVVQPSHSHDSHEYQPMIHRSHGYGTTGTTDMQSTLQLPSDPPTFEFNRRSTVSPPPPYDERYPKIV